MRTQTFQSQDEVFLDADPCQANSLRNMVPLTTVKETTQIVLLYTGSAFDPLSLKFALISPRSKSLGSRVQYG